MSRIPRAIGQKSCRAIPNIKLNNRQLPDISNDALKSIIEDNQPPYIFQQNSRLFRIRINEISKLIIEPVDVGILLNILNRVARFFEIKENRKYYKDAPLRVAQDLINSGSWNGIPFFEGVIDHPVVRKDGTILVHPGYDTQTQLYYHPTGLLVNLIPDYPSSEDVSNSSGLIKEIFEDFPFIDQASKTNMIGLLLTPFLRPAFSGHIPMALITAPRLGTGKTLLGDVVAIIATGNTARKLIYSQSEPENRKLITSVFYDRQEIVVLDNVTTILSSSVYSSLLTAKEWTDRLLSSNQLVKGPNNLIWIANGNHLQVGGDLVRRVYWIRLDAKVYRPWKREDYHHKDFMDYVSAQRSEIVRAILILIRSWYANGCPPYLGRELGGFCEWSEIVGGVLQNAGMSGFLENLDQGDEENGEDLKWVAFLIWLKKNFQQSSFDAKQICTYLQKHPEEWETIPDEIQPVFQEDGHNLNPGFCKKLGIALKKHQGVPYGSEQLFLRGQKDKHSNTNHWFVQCGSARSCGSNLATKENLDIEDDLYNKSPASSAVPAIMQVESIGLEETKNMIRTHQNPTSSNN